MASVALAAISVAALANASPAWAMAVIDVISLCLLAAALIAAAGSGRSQIFAFGFLIGACIYLLLWQAEVNGWLMLFHGDLVTTRLLDWIYFRIVREVPAAPAFGGMPGDPVVGGVGFFSGKPLGPTYVPDQMQFRKIAHWLIAWHVGAASGQFAVYWRRSRSANVTP